MHPHPTTEDINTTADNLEALATQLRTTGTKSLALYADMCDDIWPTQLGGGSSNTGITDRTGTQALKRLDKNPGTYTAAYQTTLKAFWAINQQTTHLRRRLGDVAPWITAREKDQPCQHWTKPLDTEGNITGRAKPCPGRIPPDEFILTYDDNDQPIHDQLGFPKGDWVRQRCDTCERTPDVRTCAECGRYLEPGQRLRQGKVSKVPCCDACYKAELRSLSPTKAR